MSWLTELARDLGSWLISLGGMKMMVVTGFLLYLCLQGRRKDRQANAKGMRRDRKGSRQVGRSRNPKRSR